MSVQYYKLKGKTPVAVNSFMDWNSWMASATFAETTVMFNEFKDCLISTRFVGINLNPGICNSGSKPMVFETLVMGGVMDGRRNFYPTWDDAVQGHLKICTQVFKLLE
ncbi:hypothetical protein [Nostoc sp. 2RC]|uniref:hypothetical protein n=1 Tax=Nostoc sp. 2RC TaxID=2485484 RepID=UPI001624B1D7|nr:hypothetical protein [Nostoc sp. 2RC]